MKYLLTSIFILFFFSSFSQNNCLPATLFTTDSLGTYKEKMKIPLVFNIQDSAIVVTMPGNSKDEFMSFKILNTLECSWNKDFSIGKTSFKVSVQEDISKSEPAVINVIYLLSGKKFIELLYSNSEERVFTIAK